ncbi:hypothetical protein AWW68_19540 [Roseivirga spongicola]|uniref:Uncharacterized protein n=1 Tax=Roseivirga spongicola TaxID=333140 RepID=A0A150XCM2_9BACT|nr:hypothetical protein [Roseivirga spongicola]KYG76440.1 hypothetical protein AWW68_19540 [Roseivirga spongicola]
MTESQSQNMRFDVLNIPSDERGQKPDILEHFKDLKAIDSFAAYAGQMKPNGLNRNALITYIILVYSHDSFLHQSPKYKFEEFSKRMIVAADLAGLERLVKEDGFKKNVDKRLFNLEEDEFVLMILEYLRFQSKSDWSEWCILQHELMENNKIRMSPIQEDKDKDQIAAQEKKAKFRAESEKIREALKTYELKIFGDRDRLVQVQSAQNYFTIEKLVKGEETF